MALLRRLEVQAFIGAVDYHAHIKKRFRAGDNPNIAKIKQFSLPIPRQARPMLRRSPRVPPYYCGDNRRSIKSSKRSELRSTGCEGLASPCREQCSGSHRSGERLVIEADQRAACYAQALVLDQQRIAEIVRVVIVHTDAQVLNLHGAR